MAREPSPVAILAARLMRAYPTLSPYSCASLAEELQAIERAQRMHAERRCNGPREAKGDVPGYVRLVPFNGTFPDTRAPRGMTWQHDPDAERKAGERIDLRCSRWLARLGELCGCNEGKADDPTSDMIELRGDPRGCVLLLRLPGETEASGV